MKHAKERQGGLRTAFLAVAGLLMGVGTIQVHAAEQCNSQRTDLAGVIGGSPNCADFGRVGVTVAQGDTESEMFESANCWLKVTTAAPVGSKDSETFTVLGDCPGELVLTQGATGGQSCQYVHPKGVLSDTVQTLNEKGDAVRSKALTVCTDEQAFVGTPRLVLEVFVAAGNGSCDAGLETVEVDVGDTVSVCYVLTNTGDGSARAGVDVTQDGVADFPVKLVEPGTSVTWSKEETYYEAGQVTEFAQAIGLDESGNDLTSNVDTAVVFVLALPEAPVVECDDPTQNPADLSNRLVASINPTAPNRNFECAPVSTGINPDADIYTTRAGKIQCVNECVPKPGCEFDPDNPMPLPEGCEQPCEPSGAWCTAEAPEDQLPYCWEIRDNPGCAQTSVQPAQYLMEVNKTWSVLRKNPYIMQSCTSSGGRETCITYCFLYPGDVAADVCPPGSWVY